jgi:hypothetical protein
MAVATGQCLCGGVRFEIRGPLAPAYACHCGQCRRQSGNFVVVTGARRSDVVLLADTSLAWYNSSPAAKRGFCSACGSALLWDDGGEVVSINAGCLDQPTGLRVTKHIFVADKADFTDIADGLPQFPGFGPPPPDP